MSEIILIAKSKMRESYSEEGLNWYKEYAVKVFSSDDWKEKEEIVDQYGMRELYGFSNPCVSLERKVKVKDGLTSYDDWQVYHCGDGIFNAVNTMNLDSVEFAYHPIYNQVVEYRQKYQSLKDELTKLQDRITPCKFSKNSPLMDEYLEKYYQVLKSKKLYSKAKNNQVNPNVINDIRKPINEEYQAELTRINARIEEIEKELSELESK